MLGLLAGIGLSFFLENLDDAVKTPEDLKEKLGVPLLGFVPEIRVEGGNPGPDRFRVRGTVMLQDQVSSIAEAYRGMRTGLFYSAPEGEMKVISLTSCGPSEGKTTTSANLAAAIAKSGKRVLLIDGDLHRPSVHRIFGLQGEPGLTDLLVGARSVEEAIQHLRVGESDFPNLSILTAGTRSPNPGDLLGSRRMAEVMAELRDRFDWIVVDTPPALFVSDAGILGAYCDGAILVVKAGKHNGAILRRTREHLDLVKTKIVGCILNQLVVARVGRYYSQYYYHGYARYAKDYRRYYYGDEADRTRRRRRDTGEREGAPVRGATGAAPHAPRESAR